jgi:hypothetical protein
MKMVEEKIAEIKALELKSLHLYAEVQTLVEQEMERMMYRCRNTETMQQNAQSYRGKSERELRQKKHKQNDRQNERRKRQLQFMPYYGIVIHLGHHQQQRQTEQTSTEQTSTQQTSTEPHSTEQQTEQQTSEHTEQQ